MRIDFTDCGVANEAFSAININVRGVQLDGGELKGHVEANQCGDAVFMGSFMSHRSLFTGGRMAGFTPFCWMHTGDSYYQGGPSFGGELCGFMDGINDTHVAWNGELRAVYLPTAKARAYLLEVNALKGLDVMQSLNRLMLGVAELGALNRLYEAGVAGTLKDASQAYGLIATLLEQPVEPIQSEQSCKNEPMLKQFVQIAHDEAEANPLSLAEVCQMLHVGKSTLSAACKEAYGMSVVALMRKVRLEQCRLAFLKPQGLTSVESVMRRYRFTNRNRFAAMYREAFGELPSDSYQRGQGQLKLKGL